MNEIFESSVSSSIAKTKATIEIGKGIIWCSRKKFNWYHRWMMKLCFGWHVENIKEEDKKR